MRSTGLLVFPTVLARLSRQSIAAAFTQIKQIDKATAMGVTKDALAVRASTLLYSPTTKWIKHTPAVRKAQMVPSTEDDAALGNGDPELDVRGLVRRYLDPK